MPDQQWFLLDSTQQGMGKRARNSGNRETGPEIQFWHRFHAHEKNREPDQVEATANQSICLNAVSAGIPLSSQQNVSALAILQEN